MAMQAAVHDNESQQTAQTLGERLVAVETLMPTLATKTDIAQVTVQIESLRSEITTLKWLIALAVVVTGVVVQYLNQGGA